MGILKCWGSINCLIIVHATPQSMLWVHLELGGVQYSGPGQPCNAPIPWASFMDSYTPQWATLKRSVKYGLKSIIKILSYLIGPCIWICNNPQMGDESFLKLK